MCLVHTQMPFEYRFFCQLDGFLQLLNQYQYTHCIQGDHNSRLVRYLNDWKGVVFKCHLNTRQITILNCPVFKCPVFRSPMDLSCCMFQKAKKYMFFCAYFYLTSKQINRSVSNVSHFGNKYAQRKKNTGLLCRMS